MTRTFVALAILGCASTPPPPTSTTPAVASEPGWSLRLPRLRIVDAKLGEERSSKREPLVVPFALDQNGTELVYALLERAAARGAAAVGDMTLVATFRWRGAPVECRMQVLLEGDPRLAPRAPGATPRPEANGYETEIEVYRPQPVELLTDDRDLECRVVRVAVTRRRKVPVTRDRFDVERAHLRELPEVDDEVVTRFEKRDECRWTHLVRRTTRYDYEVKIGFVPPNWEHLSQRFSRRMLVPAAPRCYTLPETEVAERPPYRLEATAYHRGKIAMRPGPTRPSVGKQLVPDLAVPEPGQIEKYNRDQQRVFLEDQVEEEDEDVYAEDQPDEVVPAFDAD